MSGRMKRYPEHGDYRRYKLPVTHPDHCRCDLCKTDYNRSCAEYRRQVVQDVKAGRREAPPWLLRRQERERAKAQAALAANQPGRQEAAEAMGRALARIAATPELARVELLTDPHKADGLPVLRCDVRIEVAICPSC